MITSPDLSALSSDELIRRLYKKDQVIALLTLLCIFGAITGFSLGFASGFVFSKGVDYAIAKNRN